MAARDDLLRRIRSALGDARGGEHIEEPYDWGRARSRPRRSPADLIEAFEKACSSLHAEVYKADTDEAVREQLLDLLKKERIRTYVSWRCPSLERFGIPECLPSRGFHEAEAGADALGREDGSAGFKSAAAVADAGITGADFGLADTGTLVLESGPGRERSVSLLPPIHVAVLCAENLLPRTADLLAGPLFSWNAPDRNAACVTLITGSSKTGDIEMELVHGVHGPGRLHVILRV
jgi:L-lactate dehydrogenase complex protein LldG